MFADQFEIEPVEQVVRTVSTAQAHHSARHHIRKGSIQIGQTLLRGSCKEEWAAFESVLAEPGRKAQRAQRLQATVNALGWAKEAGAMTPMPAPDRTAGNFNKPVIRTMPRRGQSGQQARLDAIPYLVRSMQWSARRREPRR